MKKEFSISREKAMINFTAKYCKTPAQLLESEGFERVLVSYLTSIEKKKDTLYTFLIEGFKTDNIKVLQDKITGMLKLLVVMSAEEIAKLNKEFEGLVESRELCVKLVEGIYGYWRRLERYTIVQHSKINEGLENVSFIEANTEFSALVLSTYRKIEKNIVGVKPKVYRQLPAGGNVGLITSNFKWNLPDEYEVLKDIAFIDAIVIDSPFIIYPKRNTRDGVFKEVYENPLNYCKLTKEHWFCYRAKVGELLAYVYFHRDFMAHGVTMCNLFEMADPEEVKGKKPDIVYVFGAKDEVGDKTVFYHDKENDIMLGYVSYNENIDYFGYMKKMTLTLHNVKMIEKGYLPIHGAMVNLKLKNGSEANVIIMGDSGAGKSESLEAFRSLSEDYISEMTIIFDDMGVVKIEDGKAMGYGTETGAFVRLDDLDPGYAFKEMDRSIFMNPDKINARLVMPVATYEEITRGYKIDMFLYANNYNDGEELEYFNSMEEALPTFRDGARMAKGTTTEKGLVKSFFANPFGPVQKQKETEVLLDKYFSNFFETGVKVGQLRTRLGIKGKEKNGPLKAAEKLLEAIKTLN